MSLIGAWLTLLLVGTDLFVVSPLLPDIARDLGSSVGTAGLMVSVFALAYVVGGPRLGALADRTGRRLVLLVALTLFAAANLLTALSPGLAVLLVARGVAGLAASGITPSVYALVAATGPEEKRATRLSIATSGLLLALSTGAPTGSLLARVVGWRGVFAVIAGAAVPLIAFQIRAMTAHATSAGADSRPTGADRADTMAADGTAQPAGADDIPVGSTGILRTARSVCTTGLWALAVYGVYTYLGTELSQHQRLSTGFVAVALACYGAGALAGNLIGGTLADRNGPRPVAVSSLVLLAASLAVLAATVSSRWAVGPVLCVFALCAYPYFSAYQKQLVARAGASSGRLLAWNNTAMYLGILIGSALGGRVFSSHGFGALAVSGAVVALLAAFTAARVIPADPSDPALTS
jgi:predicted MFS family arabinose efflux permease